MNKRLIVVALAAGVLLSFTACSLFKKNKEEPTESTTATITMTSEQTTTTEETTAEETTTEEETTTSEVTTATTQATTKETKSKKKASPTPAKKATAKPTKKATKKTTKKSTTKPTYIPAGWKKNKSFWGKKESGYKAYVVTKGSQSQGWYKGRWVTVYEVPLGGGKYYYEFKSGHPYAG